jgi:hypothetical protein
MLPEMVNDEDATMAELLRIERKLDNETRKVTIRGRECTWKHIVASSQAFRLCYKDVLEGLSLKLEPEI